MVEESPRPLYHFTPFAGWMNDPNGLVIHEGETHLFYQSVPPGKSGLHWGHAVSRDTVNWENLPIALAPDELGSIFSGSAVADRENTSGFFDGHENGGLVTIFTHASATAQVQSLAYSHDRGRTWTKYARNPVLTSDRKDFRDPKVFWHQGTRRWTMVLAAGDHAEIHTSPDLKTWTPASAFGGEWLLPGAVFECPDLFLLPAPSGGERWVLSTSLIGGVDGSRGGCDTHYWVGDFDGNRFQPAEGQPPAGTRTNHGPDDYAAVTWEGAPEGERVWIGWLSRWAYADKTPTTGWQGQMTVPRKLSLDAAGRLRQTPVESLQKLRADTRRWENIRADSGQSTEICADTGEAFEIVAEIRPGPVGECGLRLRTGRGGKEWTTVGLDAAAGTLFVDRTRSGQVDFHPGFTGRFDAPLRFPEGDETVRLQIFVDRYSVEVFAREGETLISALIFPAPDSRRLEFYATGGTAMVTQLDLHRLKGTGTTGCLP